MDPRNPLKDHGGTFAPLGTFSDWLDDLIRLCRSHHYGSAELMRDGFNLASWASPAAS